MSWNTQWLMCPFSWNSTLWYQMWCNFLVYFMLWLVDTSGLDYHLAGVPPRQHRDECLGQLLKPLHHRLPGVKGLSSKVRLHFLDLAKPKVIICQPVVQPALLHPGAELAQALLPPADMASENGRASTRKHPPSPVHPTPHKEPLHLDLWEGHSSTYLFICQLIQV